MTIEMACRKEPIDLGDDNSSFGSCSHLHDNATPVVLMGRHAQRPSRARRRGRHIDSR